MAQPSGSRNDAQDGFEGSIAGLGLSDVIQLNVHNRFSGCIAVQYESLDGLVFMRDGEIIHAELGDRTGEEAFYEIVAWPAGRFRLHPKVSTTRSTIRKGWQHLILEAHRLIDERRAGLRPPAAPPPPRSAGASAIDRLRQIPGVAYVVLQGRDGGRIGDDSYPAELLAGQTLFLAMAGQQLGAIFGAGDVSSALVQGTTHHLLLFGTRTHFLSVLVDGAAAAGPVEAEIRKALAGR